MYANAYPKATSSAIITLKPAAKRIVPTLECLPRNGRGRSSAESSPRRKPRAVFVCERLSQRHIERHHHAETYCEKNCADIGVPAVGQWGRSSAESSPRRRPRAVFVCERSSQCHIERHHHAEARGKKDCADVGVSAVRHFGDKLLHHHIEHGAGGEAEQIGQGGHHKRSR